MPPEALCVHELAQPLHAAGDLVFGGLGGLRSDTLERVGLGHGSRRGWGGGVYGGGLEGRDRAYHQGTVWPWPAGFYVEAALRAAPKRSRKKVATELLQWLDQLLATELDRAGIDHVSEVFDGDPPHRPGGTFAQAWNTGELLRAHGLCRAVCAGELTELP